MTKNLTDDEIVSLLEDHGPDTAAGLATRLNRLPHGLEKRLHRLEDDGRVKMRRGNYRAGRGPMPRLWESTTDPYRGIA